MKDQIRNYAIEHLESYGHAEFEILYATLSDFMDSIEIFELISALESEFEIRIPIDFFDDKKYRKINLEELVSICDSLTYKKIVTV